MGLLKGIFAVTCDAPGCERVVQVLPTSDPETARLRAWGQDWDRVKDGPRGRDLCPAHVPALKGLRAKAV